MESINIPVVKMNREQLKDHFRRATIKNVIDWSLQHYAGDGVAVADSDRLYFSSVWFGNHWKGTGWSRSTVMKRWVEFVDEGFIKTGYSHLSGYVDTSDWRQSVIDKANNYLVSRGLSFDIQDKSLFDLDSIVGDCYECLIEEFGLSERK